MSPTNFVAVMTVLSIAGLPSYAGDETALTSHLNPPSETGGHVGARNDGNALTVSETQAGAALHCGFQKLDGQVTREGLWLTSTVNSGGERFQVTATVMGRDGATQSALPATGRVRLQDSLVRWERATLTEEYSVSVDGVRQDFVITQRPEGSGDLRVELKAIGVKATMVAYGAKLRLNQSGREIAYSRLRAVDNNGKELAARIEVKSATKLVVAVEDAAAAYPVRIDPTFSDANWVSLGGLPGTSGPVSAVVANTNTGFLYVGGQFTVVGITLAANIAVWNGTNWLALGSGINSTVRALALDGAGNLYAGGSFTNAGGTAATNVAKWDGSVWTALGTGLNGTVYALAVDRSGNLYAGGAFTTAGGSPAAYIAEWNGGSWSALGSGMNDIVIALAVDAAGNLYAGGAFSNAGGTLVNRVAEWNGSTWSALGTGMNGQAYALVADGSGNLYVGGGFTSAGGVTAQGIAKWNGSAWSAVGTGNISGFNVEALVLDGSGNLYAGGNFIAIGGVTTSGIAKWNGSAWSALGPGLGQSGSAVTALAVDTLGNLYAGGSFRAGYFAQQNYIARWNGNVWSVVQPVVAGVGGKVFALLLDGLGNLYAAGQSSPAKWTGTNWLWLGSGMTGYLGQTPQVNALAVDGVGNLYAGGDFASIGGVAATNLAKWNGSAWSDLGFDGSGGGPENYVNALAVDSSGNLYEGSGDLQMWNGSTWTALGVGPVAALTFDNFGNLYAGGNFASAGGVPANNVAKWNGSTWSALGSGLNGYVYSLATDKLGDLYVGGSFGTAGGAAAANVAKWNGTAWSALGPGISGGGLSDVRALAVDPFGNVYAGGPFTFAGGGRAARVAKWDGIGWSPLGAGLNQQVLALAADSSGRLYVGGFFTTAGTNYSQYVAQANLSQGLGIITFTNNPGGAITMFLQGTPGSNCTIQTSTNLVNWSTISTNICGTNGIWTITNTVTGPQGFFRAALP